MAIETITIPGQETLQWTLNTERGTIAFGRTIPFAGNNYIVNLEGGDEDAHYVIYIMSDDGLECLAKSQFVLNDQILEFNSQALWDEFRREPHEARTFHCYVRNLMDMTVDGVTSTVEVSTVAEGDLTIMWNPLWTEAESGAAYTMKGPKGPPGERGESGIPGVAGKSAYELAVDEGFQGSVAEWLLSLRGVPGSVTKAYCEEDGKWYHFTITINSLGEKVIAISQVGEDWEPEEDERYVTIYGNQVINGVKTFSDPIDGDISGRAVKDGDGNVIAETYVPNNGGRISGTLEVSRLTADTAQASEITGNQVNASEGRFDALEVSGDAFGETPSRGNNSTQFATTAFVNGAISDYMTGSIKGIKITHTFRNDSTSTQTYEVKLTEEDVESFPSAQSVYHILIIGNNSTSDKTVTISECASSDGSREFDVPTKQFVIQDTHEYAFHALSTDILSFKMSFAKGVYVYVATIFI